MTNKSPHSLTAIRLHELAYLHSSLFARALISVILCGTLSQAGEPTLDYSQVIRPILAENCFRCHGPDDAARKADLRLDVWENDGDVRGAKEVVAPGRPDESEFYQRITQADESERMPPLDSGKVLKPDQILLLQTWIQQGGRIDRHWAFVSPIRPDVPEVNDNSWVKNPVDAFVLHRLDREGLKPSAVATRSTLLRRISLDLVGLPPTLAEIHAFETDPSPNAFAHVVARLLDSPHYGERWARWWLDAARYADSDGFEKDKPRQVWMYRDWVIRAFNQDLPYDQFVIRQVAGDLLPNASQDDRVATGFVRNSMLNEEGGIDPEQFRMESMFDRIDAIGKAMLGLTVQCAQCHTHKYDPISHTEYYRLLACLNNCHEGQITVYTPEQLAEWGQTAAIIDDIEEQLQADEPSWRDQMAAWERKLPQDTTDWTVVRPTSVGETSGGQKHYALDDGSILAQGYAPTLPTTEFECDINVSSIAAIRLELLCDPNLPHGGPGRSLYGLGALTELYVTAIPTATPDKPLELVFASATADVNPPQRELESIFDDLSGRTRTTGSIDFARDRNELTAWGWDIGPGRSNVPHEGVFVLDKPLVAEGGMKLTFKLAQLHGGWNSDDNQTNNLGRFRFSVTPSATATANPLPHAVRTILEIPSGQRTETQVRHLFSYWRSVNPHWSDANRRIDALWQSHPQGATQLALIERDGLRPTHRLERGNFLKPAEEVTPGVPSFLHPFPADQPVNRLTLAKWLVDRRSPTTARALVNRVWQAYFGRGLVVTSEDLGTQSAYPTHPELLDWLAVDFMEHGWSLKHLHQVIVGSAAYQQQSEISPALLERDPENVELARGPRFRADAEAVYDIALSVSGLLSARIGGPSVFPPAPSFLFQPPASYGPKTWNEEEGSNRYRRAMYTFRFRSVPHPALTNFDAPNGETACVRRVRTNSPLQALTTLNEPLFMECACAFGRRIVREGGESDSERLAFAHQTCTARLPTAEELSILEKFLEQQREHFANSAVEAQRLIQGSDRSPIGSITPEAMSEMAAWTVVGRVLLNLDETVTKE